AIIGAGVGGLTVAHECAEKGCDVVVFEKDFLVGGKAATDLFQGIPRDHAPKNISPYYYCLIEQLKRIPIDEHKTVYDNLIPLKKVSFRFGDKQLTVSTKLSLPAKLKRSYSMYKFLCGITQKKDIHKLFKVVFKYIFSSQKQRNELDKISYIELLDIDLSHPLAGIIESISAADPNGSALM